MRGDSSAVEERNAHRPHGPATLTRRKDDVGVRGQPCIVNDRLPPRSVPPGEITRRQAWPTCTAATPPGRPAGHPAAAGPTTQTPPRRKGRLLHGREDGFSGDPTGSRADCWASWVCSRSCSAPSPWRSGLLHRAPCPQPRPGCQLRHVGRAHLIGIASLVAGGGVVFGNMIARVVGIALAVPSAVVNLAFLPASPLRGRRSLRPGRVRDLCDHGSRWRHRRGPAGARATALLPEPVSRTG